MRFNRYNLIEAVKNNDINKINSILKSGKADINSKDKYCETALMIASYKGNLEIVKLLVDNGADVNIKSDIGNTALMFASEYGQLDIVKYLVENGADINIKDDDGESALIHALEDSRKKRKIFRNSPIFNR